MWVAVDTMSGDFGPKEIVEGCIDAINEFGYSVVLVGAEETLGELVLQYDYDTSKLRIVHAPDVIGMDESPSIAVKTKLESSVVQAVKLVAQRECVGVFSPGNTGATMTSALMHLGRISGVLRPPIAVPLPQEDGSPLLLLDAGANVDCKPEFLVQFAIMGQIYAREILKIKQPKIGLLSNGEEDKKGTHVTQKVFEKLKRMPINFIGNVEGRDLYGGGRDVDVVVCDGFIGNIVLKATEGLAKSIFSILKKNIEESSLAKAGALLLGPTLGAIKKRLNYEEYGGAVLLGVNGACIIGHGSSSALAVKNAIRVVVECAKNDVDLRIAENIVKFNI